MAVTGIFPFEVKSFLKFRLNDPCSLVSDTFIEYTYQHLNTSALKMRVVGRMKLFL